METRLNYGISEIGFVLLNDAIRGQTLFTSVTKTSLQGKKEVSKTHMVSLHITPYLLLQRLIDF